MPGMYNIIAIVSLAGGVLGNYTKIFSGELTDAILVIDYDEVPKEVNLKDRHGEPCSAYLVVDGGIEKGLTQKEFDWYMEK